MWKNIFSRFFLFKQTLPNGDVDCTIWTFKTFSRNILRPWNSSRGNLSVFHKSTTPLQPHFCPWRCPKLPNNSYQKVLFLGTWIFDFWDALFFSDVEFFSDISLWTFHFFLFFVLNLFQMPIRMLPHSLNIFKHGPRVLGPRFCINKFFHDLENPG